jgi:hypothetical protein
LGARREASLLPDGYQEGAALTLEINKTRLQDENVERTTVFFAANRATGLIDRSVEPNDCRGISA